MREGCQEEMESVFGFEGTKPSEGTGGIAGGRPLVKGIELERVDFLLFFCYNQKRKSRAG